MIDQNLNSFIAYMRQTQGFLAIIDENRMNPTMKLGEIQEIFGNLYQVNPETHFFHNQYLMISCLLSYIVLPREILFDSIPDIQIKDLNEKWGLDQLVLNSCASLTLKHFIRKLRNAISHGSLDVNQDLIFTFNDNHKKTQFQVSLSGEQLQKFTQSLAIWIMTGKIE